MTDEEFADAIAQATEELRRKQGQLEVEFGIGTFASFWFDQDKGTLQFNDDRERVSVEAKILSVGSFSLNSQTWMWAWENDSLTPVLRQKAEVLKSLFDQTGRKLFLQPVIDADEITGWEMTALAVKHWNARGAYRMPYRHLHVFVAIESLHRCIH